MVQRSYRRKQLKRRFTRHRSLIRGGTHWTRRYLDHAGNFLSYPFKYAYHNHPFRWNKSKSAAHPDAANPVSSQQTGTANRHSSVTQSKQGNSNWTEELNKLELESPKTNQSWFTALTKPLNKSSQAQNKKTNDKSDENNQEDQDEEETDGFSFNPFGRKKPKQTPQDKQQSNVGLQTKNEFNKTLDQAKRTETKSSTLRDILEKNAELAKELHEEQKKQQPFNLQKWLANTKQNRGGKRRKTRRSR